ncbi:nucleotidyl transferase AbiEii/AbiGii toxin family protein [Algoriphagus sp.]|uniref:nucleotidyl transferase AbiEii/AbiGii toxin family protein n=1 Tax=Algoriphagus sp. TaxID=1872435 RepID=UPI002728B010|nr:nucleotidyl transferase AbiEii/AbiGii toxin family protein [Algoriphagus sp.]MDO8969013.1 nucleotidyl transferase AbiEii/AbiGii toxin family protein [Algoriphagus sp.]MDP3200243.1 nucleotidyl transferase AbiEii/AbiGii toxin family protein [Algoriphagus sp.]
MIKAHCFTKEWINGFKQQKHLKRINPPILEKMIHALSLLQQLKANGLNFTFKGGTSLVLLLSKSRRFSIDIDIITTQSRVEVEAVLDKVVANSNFKSWELQDRRSYKEGVPKAHYEFDYESNLNQSAHFILLDILFEESDYPRLFSAPIQAEWIESEELLEVTVPSIESILGDKLTAFAPNTVGILYGKDKEQEIIKQLFDIGCLFDEAEKAEEIALSFEKIGTKEINYRGLEIGLPDILEDIFTTSILIAKRAKNSEEPAKSRFKELTTGILRFEGFLIAENFKIEDAILAAGKAAYLAKRLKNQDYSALEKFNGQDISRLEIIGELNFLNKLKKSRDKAAFFYWFQALS